MAHDANNFELQVIIASGKNSIEKVILGLIMALTAAHAGVKTVIFFTMQGASFANAAEGTAQEIEPFNSVQEYISMLVEAHVRLEVCTTCVGTYCNTVVDDKGFKTLREGMVYAGLTGASLRALKVKTLIF